MNKKIRERTSRIFLFHVLKISSDTNEPTKKCPCKQAFSLVLYTGFEQGFKVVDFPGEFSAFVGVGDG